MFFRRLLEIFLYLVILGALVLVIMAFGIYQREGRRDVAFRTIQKGMTQEEVAGIMGAPTWIGPCGAKFSLGFPLDCSKEFGYAPVIAPLTPSYLMIWFGHNGVVSDIADIHAP